MAATLTFFGLSEISQNNHSS